MQKRDTHIVFIIYDGITNSVFHSQVLTPLLKQCDEHKNVRVTLISFERTSLPDNTVKKIIPTNNKLRIIIGRRLPFFGSLSFEPAIWQLKRFLKAMQCDTLVARGPLAGYVVMKTVERSKKKLATLPSNITIQARGLCAEEHRFASQHTKAHVIRRLINKVLYRQFKTIEHAVYSAKPTNHPFSIFIEAVSPALKEFLVQQFHANPSQISLADKDTPKSIDPPKCMRWRKEIRTKLNIPNDCTVYCYCGSAKPWQCAQETIAYFCKQYQQNTNSLLLILSGDKPFFEKILQTSNLPTRAFRVVSVEPKQLYRYLAAADTGLLFRNEDMVNWVSRPTKMLDYQAVHLPIIHNDTIAWLAKQHP